MSSPFELRWGIIATGGISTNFSKVHHETCVRCKSSRQDLLVDPNTRDSGDIKHRIVAVGSRSVESAQAFIKKLQDLPETEAASWGVKQGLLDQAKGYASYEEVYNDPVSGAGEEPEFTTERRCGICWYTAQLSLPKCQGCDPGRKECALRETVHIRLGGARRVDQARQGEGRVLDGVSGAIG